MGLSKKQRLANFLSKTHLMELPEKVAPRLSHLTILAYHRIVDFDPATYPWDENLISATPEMFDWQMEYVSKNFDVLTLGEFAQAKRENRVPKRPLSITFDDGFRDNLQVALPILKRHGIRAVVYLATSYIGGQNPFWYEKVAYFLKQSRKQFARLGPNQEKIWLGREHLSTSWGKVLNMLKLSNEDEHAQLMKELEEQADVKLADTQMTEILTWDEVREGLKGGFEFGSHSVSHLNLATITPARLHSEMVDSKAKIEKELGESPVTIAYPLGLREHFSPEVQREAEQAGYEYGISYVLGVNKLDSLSKFALKRLNVEFDTSKEMFRANAQIPQLFTRSL